MADVPPFSGFTRTTVRFFTGLIKNNTKEWFEKNRGIYAKHVMEPAKAFVVAMGERLKTITPRIVAVPKINKSIFRLNRDTRFSLDPSPYKTNLGIYFWEGGPSRMEAPGFYFHFEPPNIMIGGGFYMFPDPVVDRFRRAAVDPKRGRELAKIIASIEKLEGWSIGGQHYKRVPAGFDPHHSNAGLLKHRGLYAGLESKVPEEFFSAALADYCFEGYKPLIPLHRWLVKLARRP